MACVFQIDLQALLPWAPFAPALAALIIGLPTILISFTALRQSAKNVEKGIQLQRRLTYLQELRLSFSKILALSSDIYHAHLKMRETKRIVVKIRSERPVPEPVEMQILDLDKRLDQLLSDFNLAFHSTLILLCRDDDPNSRIEDTITKLYDVLRTSDTALKDDSTVLSLQRECFVLFRDFSNKS